VRGFWSELTAAWRADPRLEVREVEWALRFAGAMLAGDGDALLPRRHDPIPTIAHDGGVVLLSPELAGRSPTPVTATSPRLGASPLPWPTSSPGAARQPDGWIAEYLTGVERLPRDLLVLRVLRRCPRREPVLRARSLRRHGHPPLPQQQDVPSGRGTRSCPSSLTRCRHRDAGPAAGHSRAGEPGRRGRGGLAARAEAAGEEPGTAGWRAFEDAFPTFYEFSNRRAIAGVLARLLEGPCRAVIHDRGCDLDGFERTTFSHDGLDRDVYRAGPGRRS
jgi:hypothetical protein